MKVEPSVEAKLKSELKAIEKRQSELKKEMANLDKDIAQMGLNGQARQSSILCRICQFVQQGWRTLGLFFAASLVLIPVIIAIMITSAIGVVPIEALVSVLLGALAILMLTRTLHKKEFRAIAMCLALAVAVWIVSFWVDDQATSWRFSSMGFSVLAIGLALHSLDSGSNVNSQLGEIKRELKEINQKVTKPTDGADQQAKEVKEKPQADK